MDTPPSPAPPAPPAHAVMFWALTAMALAVFAPCVLVPIWAETQELRAYEEALASQVGELESQHGRNRERIDALRADPLVNERMVRRELNIRPEGEQTVAAYGRGASGPRVIVPDGWSAEERPPREMPEDLSARAVDRLHPWLPDWPWQKLFVESPHRPLLLLMAGGLFATAFILYGPTRVTAPPRGPRGRTDLRYSSREA